jgi:hypothetical protein
MVGRSFIGALTLLMIVGLVGSHQLFADKPKKNSRENAEARPRSTKPLALPDQFPLNVGIDPRSPEPIKEKYQALVDRLNTMQIPATTVRDTYFRTHSLASSLTMIEWYAGLEAVEETPAGLMVKLKVYAKRKNVIDGLFYYEYYLVSDRGAEFIRWEHEPAQTRDVIGL